MMSDSTRTSDRDTKQVAREQGQQVKGSARDAASNVAGTAGERAREVRQQAGTHARGIAGEATRQLKGRAEQETERAGSALSNAGSQLQALAEGRIDDAGVFGDYARQAAESVNRWADSVQERGLDGLVDDLRGYARRRPGVFLVSAVAAGVVAGRFGRNLREEMSDDSSSGSSRTVTSEASGSRDPAGIPQSTSQTSSTGTPSTASGTVPSSTPPTTPPPARSADRPRDDVIVGEQQVDVEAERARADDIDFERTDVNQRRMS
jgi:hypothetical protein